MAKMRDLVSMSDDELKVLLDECKTMVVATLDKDGYPHQTAMWFAVADGKYLFQTYGSSQKIVNLRRDPRISLHWETGTAYDELRGASVRGLGRVVEEGPELFELIKICVSRNAPGLTGEALDKAAAGMARKRVAVVVTPDKTMSWDHRKMAAARAGG